MDKVEYWNEETAGLVAVVKSSIVPLIGSTINIRRKDWKVVEINYSIDAADEPQCAMRANVWLRAKPTDKGGR